MQITNKTSLVMVAMLGCMSISSLAVSGEANGWLKHKTPLVPTYSPEDSVPEQGIFIAPSGEWYKEITPEQQALHAANHNYTPLVSAVLPPLFEPLVPDSIDDYALKKDELVVINPAPDEFLWIMEGKRNAFNNLTIVLTDTQTGNGAPLHTHEAEEAHVLLKGKMAYFLGNERFVIEAPYIIHIPAMVPHAFMNISKKPVNLIGIFPNNEWQYDVLNANVFADFDPKEEKDNKASWYGKENRDKRMAKFKEDSQLNEYKYIKHSSLNNQSLQ